MMKFKLTAIIAAVLLVPAGCQRSPDSPNTRDGVEFATTIGEFSTRAADDHWDAGDEVCTFYYFVKQAS